MSQPKHTACVCHSWGCRQNAIIISVLAIFLLLAFAGGGRCFGDEPPANTAASDNAFDAIANDIEKSVLALGYPKSTADDLVLLVRGWKCEKWKEKLSRAPDTRSTGNTADAARCRKRR